MNSGLSNKRSYGKLSLDELRNLLPEFLVIEEEPYTNAQNYLIVWGCSKELIDNDFKICN